MATLVAQLELSATQVEVIDLCAKFARQLGFGLATGQVYGVLLTTAKPLSLDDLASALRVSKTSASSASRQLLAVNAIRQVWIPGERRTHFEARMDLLEVIRANYHSLIKPPAERARGRLDALLSGLDRDLEAGRIDQAAHAATRARLEAFQSTHRQLLELLPLIERLL